MSGYMLSGDNGTCGGMCVVLVTNGLTIKYSIPVSLAMQYSEIHFIVAYLPFALCLMMYKGHISSIH